jgi:hypothetical protein
MNNSFRNTIEQRARELRREEVSRLFSGLIDAIGNYLRRSHEAWLRNQTAKEHAAHIGRTN